MGKSGKKEKELIPKGFLYALLSLVLICLCLVFFSALTNRPMMGVPLESEINASLQLKIVKLDGGSVSILDYEDKEVLNSRDGKSGFISVILTGLEYNRKKTGIDLKSNYPIIVVKYESGRITVKDLDSDWDMNVTSFGKKNAELFVSMFKNKGEI